jgi:hypothetical protein
MAGGCSACQGGLAASGATGLVRLMARQDEERAKRLAEALRENLRRRKAQARGEEDDMPSPSHPAAPGGPLPLPDTGEGD